MAGTSVLSILLVLLVAINSYASTYIDLENYNYPFLDDPEAESSELRLTGHYRQNYQFSNKWRFKFEPGLRASTQFEEDAYFDPQELQLEFLHENTFVQAGYLSFPWEGTDFINPIDIASIKDDRDPLNPHAMSSAGINLGMFGDWTEWNIFYIPAQTEPKSFGEKSPWLPRKVRLPIQTDEIELQIPDTISYRVNDPIELDDALENNFGFRGMLHFDNLDITFAGFYGANQNLYMSPIVDVTPVSTSPKPTFELQSPVTLQPLIFKRQTLATMWAYTQESYIVRLAARTDDIITEDARLPSNTSTYVLSLEKAISDWTVLTNLVFTEYDKSSSLSTITSLLERGFLFGLRKPINDTNTINFGGYQSMRDSSLLLQAEWAYNYSANLNIKLSADYLNGPDDELLGILNDRNRINLKTTSTF